MRSTVLSPCIARPELVEGVRCGGEGPGIKAAVLSVCFSLIRDDLKLD